VFVPQGVSIESAVIIASACISCSAWHLCFLYLLRQCLLGFLWHFHFSWLVLLRRSFTMIMNAGDIRNVRAQWSNLAAAGNGAMALGFHIKRLDRAVPEPHR